MQMRLVARSFALFAGMSALVAGPAVAQVALSHIGQAVYQTLQTQQAAQRGSAGASPPTTTSTPSWIVQSPRSFGKR